MRARLTAVAAVAALALAATPAMGQELPTPTPTPTPTASPPASTPTPTPTPTAEEQARAKRDARDRKAKLVKRIYRDFERDGRIDDCDHTEKALKRARRSIEDSYAEEYPDFRDALTAALERHRDGKCVEVTPTPTPTPTPAPGGTTPPPPASTPAPPPPASTPDSGTLPDSGGGSGGGSGDGGSKGGSGGTFTPPGEGDIPEGALPSPAPTATPQALPPKLVVTRAGTAPSLLLPGTMLAIALLGLLIAALTGLFAKRTGRLAGVGHAWREAGWRASGTWSEFTDWLRTGR
jgi:hypothetical protein